jgi:tetratricopeptide (TPR) repeat protein
LPLAALVEADVRGFDETKDSSLLSHAQTHLRAAQNLNPDSVSVHFAAGRLYEATGEYEKARDQYARARELEPQSTRALIRVARMYDKLDMPDKAIEIYREAISIDPASYKAYEHLGYFYYFRGKYFEAAEQFRKVTELAPRESLAYTNLGSSLGTIGQNAEAERAYLASLRIELTADALEGMGGLLAAGNRDEEAIPYYERALLLDPHDYSYLLNLGDSHRRLHHARIAEAQYRKGMDLALTELRENPRMANARASVAYFAALLGLKDRAEDEIKQALRLAHDDNRVIFLAVKTYDSLGMRDSAVSALAEATPQVLSELSREPDLADFSRDPRFKEVVATANKGDNK